MVSLGDSSRRSGGYFFDHDSGIHYEDEPLVTLEPVTVEQPTFNALPTVRILVSHTVILILAEVSVIVLPFYCSSSDGNDGGQCGLSSYAWVALVQTLLWTLFLLLHFHFSSHLDRIRLRGYLDFYRRFYRLKWITLLVLSTGCATMSTVLVIVSSVSCPRPLHAFCSAAIWKLEPVYYAQIVVSAQIVFLVPFYLLQIRRTYRFHSRRYPPDAQREELAPSGSFRDSCMFSAEIGYRGSGEDGSLEDVMERQLDVIRYLRQHNAILSRKIVQLSEQNDHLASSRSRSADVSKATTSSYNVQLHK